MKIIFDSEEQKEALYHSILIGLITRSDCPGHIPGLFNDSENTPGLLNCSGCSCMDCWDNIIEVEIKGE